MTAGERPLRRPGLKRGVRVWGRTAISTGVTETPALTLSVEASEEGARLDAFLVARAPDMSRKKARDVIAAGQVRINGRRRKKGDRVQAGDQVTMAALPEPSDFSPAPSAEPIEILHEDASFVVANKPRGLPTHPLRPAETDTFAQRLLHVYPEMAGVGYAAREPGVLHRLDVDTSGVLVAARSAEAFDTLRADLRAGRWKKRYQALCVGLPRPETIRSAMSPDPQERRRMVALLPDQAGDRRVQETTIDEVRDVGVLTSDQGDVFEASLVTLSAPSATRHQVRVHLAYLGHPLVGDVLYRGPVLAEGQPAGHWLHASEVELPHPTGGPRLRVQAGLPGNMLALFGGG